MHVYFFENAGGNYYNTTELGFTNIVHPLVPGPNGAAQRGNALTVMGICPYAFNDPIRPVSYRKVDITQRAIEAGASCNYMYEDDWSELKTDPLIADVLYY